MLVFLYGREPIMPLEFHQVDAFTDQPFAGNPAMVYRLDAWLDEALMQRIAAEHNLAETAFVVKEGEVWHIRWFTPTSEVPLCGHATLASAKVLFDLYHEAGDVLQFTCKSGALRVTRQGERLELDFPVRPLVPVAAALQAGTTWINAYNLTPVEAPFGGVKLSGIGRENHKMMLDHYQQTKNLLVSYSDEALGFF